MIVRDKAEEICSEFLAYLKVYQLSVFLEVLSETMKYLCWDT
jgi:hypothetical protein